MIYPPLLFLTFFTAGSSFSSPAMKTLLHSLAAFVCLSSVTFGQATPSLNERASQLIIPRIDFKEATIPEVLDFLAQRGIALDGKGINIIFAAASAQKKVPLPPAPPPGIPGLDVVPTQPNESITRLTLTLNKVPLSEVFRYVSNLADLGLRWDEQAVVFTENAAKGPGIEAVPRPAIQITPGKGGEKLIAALAKQPVKFPKIDLRESSVREACDFLQQRYKSLAPDAAPLNIIMKFDEAKPPRPITFAASDVPVVELLRYIAELGGVELAAEEFAFVLSSPK